MSMHGVSLCKGGTSLYDTPSHLIVQALQLSLHSKINRKLTNHRMTTIADLMIFPPDQSNYWAIPLITSRFPLILDLLPTDTPAGHRILSVGQFWSLENAKGLHGHVLEILGVTPLGLVNLRRWILLIPRTTWLPENVTLHRRERKTNYGSTLRPLDSVEALALQYFFPSIFLVAGSYRSIWAQSNLPP